MKHVKVVSKDMPKIALDCYDCSKYSWIPVSWIPVMQALKDIVHTGH